MLPLLSSKGATTFVDVLVGLTNEVSAGQRPVTIALYGARASELGPELSRRLLESGRSRFHVDCLGVKDEVVQKLWRQARELAVSGHLTLLTPEDFIPRRAPGTYDLLYSHDRLCLLEERDELLEGIDQAMSPSSVLLVNEPLGSPLVEAEEAHDIVDFFCSKLLPRHMTRWEPEVARAKPRDSGLFVGLASRFAVEAVTPFGGIADPFVDPLTGLLFSEEQSEDRRFVDFLGELEVALRKSLSPTRVLAKLRKAGSLKKEQPLPSFAARSSTQLVVPEEMGFDFEQEESVFSHTMAGASDAPFLSVGFYDWEPEEGIRWAAPVFALSADFPTFEKPTRCRFTVRCHEPGVRGSGGVTFFVNGRRVGRRENVYEALKNDDTLVCDFRTEGGRASLTCVFDSPQKEPDPVDDRELSVAVYAFSGSVLWGD